MNDGEVQRLDAKIDGLDVITHGGLPQGRLTLVAGTSGSGKTIFATQFLVAGAASGQAGVFVTFEERPVRIKADVQAFGWELERWEKEGTLCFVDASMDFAQGVQYSGHFDLAPLVARVKSAVDGVDAKRVVMDSIGALINQFEDAGPARRALFEIAGALADAGVTTLMTAERAEDYGPVAQHGFEEFVADAVILLRNSLAGEKRRRTIEILKIRGGSHAKGEHLFTIRRDEGIVVVPNAAISFDYDSSTERVTSGNPGLDSMLSGGLFAGSLILVSGPTGTGKSLLATQFVSGASVGERVLFNSFEESAQQITRNAKEWGLDLEGLSDDGRLLLLAAPPESMPLEDHLLRIKESVDTFRPTRVVIDSLTALERISTVKSFREYVLGLAFYLKKQGIVGLFTATSGGTGAASMTLSDLHVSTITDTIIVLQYVAVGSRLSRGIHVLKMRGSDHDKELKEFRINNEGLHIGNAFGALQGAWIGPRARSGSNGEAGSE